MQNFLPHNVEQSSKYRIDFVKHSENCTEGWNTPATNLRRLLIIFQIFRPWTLVPQQLPAETVSADRMLFMCIIVFHHLPGDTLQLPYLTVGTQCTGNECGSPRIRSHSVPIHYERLDWKGTTNTDVSTQNHSLSLFLNSNCQLFIYLRLFYRMFDNKAGCTELCFTRYPD